MNAASFFASLGLSAITVLLLVFLAVVLSAYVKIATVLSIVRVGLGSSSLPWAFVTSGLALTLSFFVMYPTMLESARAVDKVLQVPGTRVDDTRRAIALTAGFEKWKGFLKTHAHKTEVDRFVEIAAALDKEPVAGKAALEASSWRILAPAFLVSELKEAFATGLSLFLPFLVIDLLIANVLLAVGLERLSAVAVAFPFKILLFVMVDGWSLITSNLVATYV